ncbi:ornithine carbamoyltransferase [Ignavigranum ruoffiae]|uniref:Ornithine carbamoyltransferase n=1 Tax=Ignavigranum ruoffiae TaxID=89093 RepID=A0A1H9B476_9LACT|nr:ornithine carbamoyltransferase [Ignavigranum ruoffiae]SEP83649.1 ornithine carbamoyltransferase [Ignavigranum ruoffiae]
MRNNFKGKDFLALKDLSREEILYLVESSLGFKKKWTNNEPHEYLKGQVWAGLFEKNSTRTRNALERAAADLGIKLVYLRPDEMQMTRGEPLKDTCRILDRYFDGLFIRTFGHTIVEECAKWMNNPVINGLTNEAHPTQGIADLMTIYENFGQFRGIKICHSGNIYNVAYTTMIMSATLGMDCFLACPPSLKPNKDIMEIIMNKAKKTGSKIVVTDDYSKALENADVVYGNAQYSMGQTDEEIMKLKEAFAPYQITMDALNKANPNCIFMHCLPAHRGEEVTDEVMESEKSVIFDEGENRMHSIKAIIAAYANK